MCVALWGVTISCVIISFFLSHLQSIANGEREKNAPRPACFLTDVQVIEGKCCFYSGLSVTNLITSAALYIRGFIEMTFGRSRALDVALMPLALSSLMRRRDIPIATASCLSRARACVSPW